MPEKVTKRIERRFASVNNPQELNRLKQRIKELEAAGKQGFTVEIEKISNSLQSRRTFPEAAIAERARSLLTEGQLDAIILFPIDDGSYLLEDGEVTWRAAKKLVEAGHYEYRHLFAIESNLDSPEQIHLRSLLHHLHQLHMNQLDRAESVMQEIEAQLQIDTPQAISLLRNIEYKIKRDCDLSEVINNYNDEIEQLEGKLSPEQVSLVKLFFRFQLNIVSFTANDLTMLLLPDDLKRAIREKDLSCKHAKIIARLKPKKLPKHDEEECRQIRQTAIERVLRESLSASATNAYVKSLIDALIGRATPIKITSTKAIDTIKSLPLNNYDREELKQLGNALAAQLENVENLLSRDR